MRTNVLCPVEREAVKTELIVSKSIVEASSNRPFQITLANMTNSSITVPKHMKISQLTEPPTKMVNMIDELPMDLQEEKSINAVQVYKGGIDTNEEIRPHEEVKTSDESRKERDWREQLVFIEE